MCHTLIKRVRCSKFHDKESKKRSLRGGGAATVFLQNWLGYLCSLGKIFSRITNRSHRAEDKPNIAKNLTHLSPTTRTRFENVEFIIIIVVHYL